MTPWAEKKLLERLAGVVRAPKAFDSLPSWHVIRKREAAHLRCVVGARIGGFLIGVAIRIETPQNAWERDVYGHVEVNDAAYPRTLRLMPVEWRPLHPHTNGGTGPLEHRFMTLRDRWHPFEENVPLGLDVFQQAARGVAVPLPRAVASFSEYLNLCAELWNCPDVRRIPAPEWTEELI